MKKTIILILCTAILIVVAGCYKKPGQAEAEEFFADWLKAHGETNVICTADGVGIKDNATRLSAAIYSTQGQRDQGYSVETEFVVLLPSKQEIVEYIAGVGDTKDKAFRESLVNFALTTFHPVYKSFINPSDPHQVIRQIVINGENREIIEGDIMMRGEIEENPLKLEDIQLQIREAISTLSLSKETHWIKIVYSQINKEPMIVSATLDNYEDQTLTSTIKNLNWPRRDEFYMAKWFINIK